ncbi:MAG: Mur ligase domain-containing protein [Candidatus Manganitrophus sp.]|nr:Mur ligase domain-containing protein [Candidatus Manganitrophus sp.]
MFRKVQHIHFVGIGGVGMSGIAEILLNMGFRVSGSDRSESEQTRRLASMGGTIHVGHDPGNIVGAEVLVYSSAVRPDNVEIVAARQQKIPVIPRAEMLAELMRLRYGIAVAGAHGKTTTTTMVATVLAEGGLDPTAVIGGKVNSFGGHAKKGEGDFLVAEADESDGSFLKLSPTVAVVTTIDREHLDYYRTFEAIQATFLSFINKVPFYGLAVLCGDDRAIAELIPKVEKRYLTYGTATHLDLIAEEMAFQPWKTTFQARFHGGVARTLYVAGAGPTQCPECPGRDRGRIGTGDSGRVDPEGIGRIPGGGATVPAARGEKRRLGHRRLWTSSDRDPGDPGGGEAGVGMRAGRPFSAASLHADERSSR